MKSVEHTPPKIYSLHKSSSSPKKQTVFSLHLPHILSQSKRNQSILQRSSTLPIQKLLKKIRGDSRYKYVPSSRQYSEFQTFKKDQLKRQYMNKKSSGIPFDNSEVDPIVINCWDYGESYGRTTVWRKYRENVSDLSYDTLKILKHNIRL